MRYYLPSIYLNTSANSANELALILAYLAEEKRKQQAVQERFTKVLATLSLLSIFGLLTVLYMSYTNTEPATLSGFLDTLLLGFVVLLLLFVISAGIYSYATNKTTGTTSLCRAYWQLSVAACGETSTLVHDSLASTGTTSVAIRIEMEPLTNAITESELLLAPPNGEPIWFAALAHIHQEAKNVAMITRKWRLIEAATPLALSLSKLLSRALPVDESVPEPSEWIAQLPYDFSEAQTDADEIGRYQRYHFHEVLQTLKERIATIVSQMKTTQMRSWNDTPLPTYHIPDNGPLKSSINSLFEQCSAAIYHELEPRIKSIKQDLDRELKKIQREYDQECKKIKHDYDYEMQLKKREKHSFIDIVGHIILELRHLAGNCGIILSSNDLSVINAEIDHYIRQASLGDSTQMDPIKLNRIRVLLSELKMRRTLIADCEHEIINLKHAKQKNLDQAEQSRQKDVVKLKGDYDRKMADLIKPQRQLGNRKEQMLQFLDRSVNNQESIDAYISSIANQLRNHRHQAITQIHDKIITALNQKEQQISANETVLKKIIWRVDDTSFRIGVYWIPVLFRKESHQKHWRLWLMPSEMKRIDRGNQGIGFVLSPMIDKQIRRHLDKALRLVSFVPKHDLRSLSEQEKEHLKNQWQVMVQSDWIDAEVYAVLSEQVAHLNMVRY